jgi:hypothetical protein
MQLKAKDALNSLMSENPIGDLRKMFNRLEVPPKE